MGRLRFIRRLFSDVPRYTKLSYCLWRDPRVPVRNKAAMGAALVLIATPFVDIPLWVPVLGEMDVVALALLAARLFVAAAPTQVVAEHEEAIRERRSIFDVDVERGQKLAVALSRRLRRQQVPTRDVVGHAERSAAGSRPAGGKSAA